MKISIILTAYKTEHFIEYCLDSIENQTYFKDNDDYELLLGIDFCEDTLLKVEKIKHKYRNLKVLYMLSNLGTYVTSNTLLSIAQGEYILRFDTDDIMKDNMIESLMNLAPDYDYIFYKGTEFGKLGTKTIYQNKEFMHHGSILYKKIILEKIGGYRDWRCAADTDFKKRLDLAGYKSFYLDESIFFRRSHSNQLTKMPNTDAKSNLRRSYRLIINDINNYNELYVIPVINKFKYI